MKSLLIGLLYLGLFSSDALGQDPLDIAEVKRYAPFSLASIENAIVRRQTEVDGCVFHASGNEPTPVPFDPIKLLPSIGCDSDTGCDLEARHPISLSYSQTWEVGKQSGATILEVVQASVSFSDSRTYTEETSSSVAYTISLKKGQGGYMQFTPLYECFEGFFTGSNCRAATDSQGWRTSFYFSHLRH